MGPQSHPVPNKLLPLNLVDKVGFAAFRASSATLALRSVPVDQEASRYHRCARSSNGRDIAP